MSRKQPLQVVIGKGKSNHLTKEMIREREEEEERKRGEDDKVEPPSYFNAAQKKEFNRIADELKKMEFINNLDVDILSRYVISHLKHIEIEKQFRKIKPTIESEDGEIIANETYLKLIKARNTVVTECTRLGGELGLSFTSRLKMTLPPKKEKEVKTEAEKRFKGRI